MNNRQIAEVFPPGDFLKEELDARGWTQSMLATVMGRPVKTINEIILGKRSITAKTAHELSHALGTSAELWLNLESAYQLSRVKDESTNVTKRSKLYDKCPIAEMRKRRWIRQSEDADVLEQEVLKFFSISSLDDEIVFQQHAARKSTSYETAPTAAQHAWMFRARHLASSVPMPVKKFSEKSFETMLERLKLLLPSVADTRQVPRILADAGIRLVVVEPLTNTKIDGITFWLDPQSPVIAMSIRNDRIDWFWHTLWHEIGHVKSRDGLTAPVLDVDLVGAGAAHEDKPEAEKAIDRFACECSVPKADLDFFIARVRPLYSKVQIKGFAARMKVHPGIVVGQLQYRHEIDWSHSREMLEKIRHLVTQAALTDGWGQELPEDL